MEEVFGPMEEDDFLAPDTEDQESGSEVDEGVRKFQRNEDVSPPASPPQSASSTFRTDRVQAVGRGGAMRGEKDMSSFGEPEYDTDPKEAAKQKKVERQYLVNLHGRNVDEIGLGEIKELGLPGVPAGTDGAKLLDRAFRNLESKLGNAGKRCIEAYTKWGSNFWTTDLKKELDGLLKGYWHQISISAGIRAGAIRHAVSNKEGWTNAIDVVLPPLMTQMTTNPKGFPYDTIVDISKFKSATGTNPLQLEAGHYNSISTRIKTDKRQIPGELKEKQSKEKSWVDLVTKGTATWDAKKLKGPAVIIGMLRAFLINPSLVAWNNLINALVLDHFYGRFETEFDEYLDKKNGGWQKQYARLGIFVDSQVTKLWNALAKNKQEPEPQSQLTWFIPGYRGTLGHLAISDKRKGLAAWNAIGTLIDSPATLSQKFGDAPIDFDDPEIVNSLEDKMRGQAVNLSSDEPPAKGVDDAIRERQKKKAKKSSERKDKSKRRAEDMAASQIEMAASTVIKANPSTPEGQREIDRACTDLAANDDAKRMALAFVAAMNFATNAKNNVEQRYVIAQNEMLQAYPSKPGSSVMYVDEMEDRGRDRDSDQCSIM